MRAHLQDGGIIGYPTETVYGFGCMLIDDALDRLAALKGRDATKPFLLLTSEPFALPGLQWNAPAKLLARHFWPGPLTIAVAADADRYQPPVRSLDGTVAVRHTPHTALIRLLQMLGEPITSTSANSPGEPPASSADEVLRIADVHPDARILVLDGGPTRASSPSTVVDCANPAPRVLREGAVSADAVRAALATEGYATE